MVDKLAELGLDATEEGILGLLALDDGAHGGFPDGRHVRGRGDRGQGVDERLAGGRGHDRFFATLDVAALKECFEEGVAGVPRSLRSRGTPSVFPVLFAKTLVVRDEVLLGLGVLE